LGFVHANDDEIATLIGSDVLTPKGCADACVATDDCVGFYLSTTEKFCTLGGVSMAVAQFRADSSSYYVGYDLSCFICSTPVATNTTSTTSNVTTTTTTTSQCTSLFATATSANYFPGNGEYYVRFYSGAGYETNTTTDSGNDNSYPAITSYYASTYSACQAAKACINEAYGDENEYYSIDLHFLTSRNQWECFQYYNPSAASDFNVPNSDVAAAYGYNIGSAVGGNIDN